MTTSHHRQQRRPLHRLATAGVNILLLAITLAGLAELATALRPRRATVREPYAS